MKPKFRSLPIAPALAAMLAGPFLQAADQSWDGGSSGSATAWLTTANWVGDAGYPGSQSVTTNTDIATFTATGTNTTVGINMNFTGNTLYLGAIEMTGNRTRTFGNSTTAANGALVLNGAAVNSVANTILRNSSSNLMTLQNTQGSGDKTMDVVLGNATDNIIQITGSGGVTISSKITGTGRQLSRQGTDTGTGSLTLSGDNTFSGGLKYSGLGTLALQHSNAAGAGTISLASTQTGTAATFSLSGGINVANVIVMDAATGRNTINSLGTASNTLSGNITINNTYTGNTLVSAGTLLVNGSLGNTAVSVDPLAVFGGTGTIAGSLSFAATSKLQVNDINNPLTVGGTVTFGDGFGIANLLGIDWDGLTLNTSYTILDRNQDFSLAGLQNFGFDNRVAVGDTNREAYFTSGSLAVIVIPEPRAALLGGIGLFMLLRRRRN